MFRFGLKKNEKSRICTLIGRQTIVEGGLTFAEGIHVDGTILGDVMVENIADFSEVCIGNTGIIKGAVRATNIVVHGTVYGDILASDRVVIGPNAKVSGDVYYTKLDIDKCGDVDGRLIPNKLHNGTPKSNERHPEEAFQALKRP